MSRLETNDGDHAAAPTDSQFAEIAALANKTSALTTKHSPTTKARVLSWRTRLLVSLAWLITLTIGSVASLRIFYHDGTHILIWLNAFTRYVYVPTYACLTLALWKRRWWLALANLAIVSCHLWWIAPDFVRDRRFDPAPNVTAAASLPARSVRIFFANVLSINNEFAAMLHEIEEANPDVVVLVEFNWPWRVAFRDSPVIAAFPYGDGLKHCESGTINMFSKLPLKSETREFIAGRCIDTVEIPLDSQVLRLVGLHAPRPMDYLGNDYDGYWSHVLPLLLSERGPSVIVGDCNATQYSLVYKRLKAGRLRSAHEDRGRGYAVSWPNGDVWLPPIRIDQAFLTPDVACLDIVEGEGRGSDHKPFILDVQIREQSE